jgi:hypothetical protein
MILALSPDRLRSWFEMILSWPENTADCGGAYQMALRDAPIKSEPGSGCFEQS